MGAFAVPPPTSYLQLLVNSIRLNPPNPYFIPNLNNPLPGIIKLMANAILPEENVISYLA
jgi:hypothetical protein